MKLIVYKGTIKYEKSPTITMYERWSKDDLGNVIQHTSYDLKTWTLKKTAYPEIPVFILTKDTKS